MSATVTPQCSDRSLRPDCPLGVGAGDELLEHELDRATIQQILSHLHAFLHRRSAARHIQRCTRVVHGSVALGTALFARNDGAHRRATFSHRVRPTSSGVSTKDR